MKKEYQNNSTDGYSRRSKRRIYKLYYSKPELEDARRHLNLRRCERLYTPVMHLISRDDFDWVMYRLICGEDRVMFTVEDRHLAFISSEGSVRVKFCNGDEGEGV